MFNSEEINKLSKVEMYNKIVLITMNDYRRAVFSDVSCVKLEENKIVIVKLSDAGKKVETKFVMTKNIQKITIAQSLYEHEIISQESLDCLKNEDPDIEEEEFNNSNLHLN